MSSTTAGWLPGHAVAILGHADEDVDESDLALEAALDGQGVFGELFLDAGRILVPAPLDGPRLADDQALAAADAFRPVDDDLALGLDDGRLRAMIEADPAVAARLGRNPRMDHGMLVELPRPGRATHPHVLDGRRRSPFGRGP